jgi:hypothetical protein
MPQGNAARFRFCFQRRRLLVGNLDCLVKTGRPAGRDFKHAIMSEREGGATPWNTIALGSLLLISACLKGGQEVQSPQPEKSEPPVKMEQRGRILGIGGVLLPIR